MLDLAPFQTTRRTPANASITALRSRQMARIVRIQLQSGRVLRLTDWPAAITINGHRYTPGKPFPRSPLEWERGGIQLGQQRREGGFREQSSMIEGLIDDDLISLRDIDQGALNMALVWTSSVDPRWPWIELPGGLLYRIERVSRGTEGRFEADIVSEVSRKLDTRRGRVITRNCNERLFGPRCNRPDEEGGEPPLNRLDWLIPGCTIVRSSSEFEYSIQLPDYTVQTVFSTPNFAITSVVVGSPTFITTSQPLPYGVGDTFTVRVFGISGITPSLNNVNYLATVTGPFQFSIDAGLTTSGTADITNARYFEHVGTDIQLDAPHGLGRDGKPLQVPMRLSGVTGNTDLNTGYLAGQIEVVGPQILRLPFLTTAAPSSGGNLVPDLPPHWLSEGEMTFTDANSDRYEQVTSIVQELGSFPGVPSSVDLTADQPALGRFAVGEQVSLQVGCRWRLFEDCQVKFGNTKNFQGIGAYSVSTTQAVQVPEAR